MIGKVQGGEYVTSLVQFTAGFGKVVTVGQTFAVTKKLARDLRAAKRVRVATEAEIKAAKAKASKEPEAAAAPAADDAKETKPAKADKAS